MITTQYNYRTLSRIVIDGKRYYTLDDDSTVPPMASVTTILDITKSKESREGLQNWRNAVGDYFADAVTYEAACRGTRLHKYLETYIKTGKFPSPGSNPYAIQANKMAYQIVENGLKNMDEFWGIEVALCHPEIYAGTTDLVGVHDKSIAIIDYKQSNKVKKEKWIDDYFCQLVAYGNAHDELYGTNIQKGVVMMCTKDCEYLEFVLEGNKWKTFEKKWWDRVEKYFNEFYE